MTPIPDPFSARDTLEAGGHGHVIYRLDAVAPGLDRTPYTIKVLLENLLRNAGNGVVREERGRALAAGGPRGGRARDALPIPRACCCRTSPASRRGRPGGDARARWRAWAATRAASTRCVPADLVIDHSVQVDRFGTRGRLRAERRARVRAQRERYALLRWAQQAFENFRVVPPGHRHRPPGQPRVPGAGRPDARRWTASWWPSRTPWSAPIRTRRWSTALGVLGWGVGGIEAEAVLLGQPLYLLTPEVVGFRSRAQLPGARRRPTSC